MKKLERDDHFTGFMANKQFTCLIFINAPAPHTMHLHNKPYKVCNVDDHIPTAVIISSQHSSNWAESQSDTLQALFDTTLLLTCPLHIILSVPVHCLKAVPTVIIPAYL